MAVDELTAILNREVMQLREDNDNLRKQLVQARHHGPKISSVVEKRSDGSFLMRAIESTHVEGDGVVVVII